MNDKIYKREEISQERIFGCLNRWYTKWKKDDWGDKGKLFVSAYEDLVNYIFSGEIETQIDYKETIRENDGSLEKRDASVTYQEIRRSVYDEIKNFLETEQPPRFGPGA